MQASRLALVLASASFSVGILLATSASAQLTPQQQEQQRESRARARAAAQPRPQPEPRARPLPQTSEPRRGPMVQNQPGYRPQTGYQNRPMLPQRQPPVQTFNRSPNTFSSGGRVHADRQVFVRERGRQEMGRRRYYEMYQAMLAPWIAANDHLYVHAENADATASGDADGYDWDEVSTDAVQACIDYADSTGADDSTCQVVDVSSPGS